jgi:hypothetical protein
VCGADNLTTFMCLLSKNLGASTSWSPKGLPRPVWDCFTFTLLFKVLGLYSKNISEHERQISHLYVKETYNIALTKENIGSGRSLAK